MANRKVFNPFYPVLLVAGTLFAITAVAYGVMSLRDLRSATPVVVAAQTPESTFDQLLKRHGTRMLIGELIVLGLATIGVIVTDQYWDQREASIEGDLDAGSRRAGSTEAACEPARSHEKPERKAVGSNESR